jgi:hypothetical protein
MASQSKPVVDAGPNSPRQQDVSTPVEARERPASWLVRWGAGPTDTGERDFTSQDENSAVEVFALVVARLSALPRDNAAWASLARSDRAVVLGWTLTP